MPTHRHRAIPPSRHGFTLVEAVLACFIMGVMLVPALSLIGSAARTRRIVPERVQAMALARQLLTEVMQCRYSDPDGTETGESRTSWDDVSDYDGFTDAPPTYRNGSAITGFTGWNRKVKVDLVVPTDLGSTTSSDKGLKRISIEVTSGSGRSYVLQGLRSSASGYERNATTATTYASWVEVTLDIGGSNNVSGTNLRNQVP